MNDIKLNIGAGEHQLPGYFNLDRKTGQEAYPLEGLESGSVAEVRASHILEHFSHREASAVLAEWVRVLKPGGVLKVAVPDFAWIAEAYRQSVNAPLEGYLMGGQSDADDFHRSVWDEETLSEALRAAGLVAVSRWSDNAGDCSSLPVSLNLMGLKPGGISLGKVSAVMSVPRLGFMDNFFSAFRALVPYGIPLRKTTGAFWGQCLERAMDEAKAEGAEWLLTIDYDSVFDSQTVATLLSVASRHPEADAIAPIQAARSWNMPLMTIRGEDGRNISQAPADMFSPEVTKINTAHFGLTLVRVSALDDLSRPWFWSKPGDGGSWDQGSGKEDDDIYFWRRWEEAGKSLYLANRVTIGHLELMIRWPGRDFGTVYQHPSDYFKEGVPEDVWK